MLFRMKPVLEIYEICLLLLAKLVNVIFRLREAVDRLIKAVLDQRPNFRAVAEDLRPTAMAMGAKV